MADSRSHSSDLDTRPTPQISVYIPDRMSPPCREGIIAAAMNRENAQVSTSTGSIRSCPLPTGIFGFGNHRSHWVNWPGS